MHDTRRVLSGNDRKMTDLSSFYGIVEQLQMCHPREGGDPLLT